MLRSACSFGQHPLFSFYYHFWVISGLTRKGTAVTAILRSMRAVLPDLVMRRVEDTLVTSAPPLLFFSPVVRLVF